MIVVWSKRAQAERLKTFDYIECTFGHSAALRFDGRVRQFMAMVADNPGIGRPEPLLSGCEVTFQSFVLNELNTIVYYISGDMVIITDLWNSRRLPENKIKDLIR